MDIMAESIETVFNFELLDDVWLKYTDRNQVIDHCLQQHLPAAIRKLNRRVDEKNFNILSIGSGNGRFDHQILTEVIHCLNNEDSKQEVNVSNTAIEPNWCFVKHYKDVVREKAELLQDGSKKVIQFELENKTFEEYESSDHKKNHFDMIHAIHSFSFLEDPKSSLKHCYENELKEKGFIAAIMSHGKSDDVFQLIASILNKHRPEGEKSKNWQESVDFASHMTANYERVPFFTTMDVTDVFNENSQTGNLLLDALACKNDFFQTAGKRVADEVRQKVKELSFTDNKGRLVIRIEDELILIHKP